MRENITVRLWSCVIAAALLLPISASALPFNDDMVDIQKRTGSIMRPRPEGSVPVGSLAYRVESKEVAAGLSNPLRGDVESTARGERLYATMCLSCHGDIAAAATKPGPVGARMGAPDLSLPMYHESNARYTDGFLFGVIHFGSVIMPAQGWKLSPVEHWDIVNYIRKVQAGK